MLLRAKFISISYKIYLKIIPTNFYLLAIYSIIVLNVYCLKFIFIVAWAQGRADCPLSTLATMHMDYETIFSYM